VNGIILFSHYKTDELFIYNALWAEMIMIKTETNKTKDSQEDLTLIADMLQCPFCLARIQIQEQTVRCAQCNKTYPIYQGVPLFARAGSADSWGQTREQLTSESYQQNYQEVQDARDYNLKYRKYFLKRLSTKREYQLLNQLLSRQEHCATMLDLPCGGGRLSPQLAPFTDLLIEADIAVGQILFGKANSHVPTRRIWMTASAFHIPFQNSSIDAIVCVRLCHHLPASAERERLFCELLRVTRKFVIMSFFDYHSFKNTLRRMSSCLRHKKPKNTMTIQQVAEIARKNAGELVTCPSLSILGSGHRYALIKKK